MIPIFIGYDSRERAATNVLIDSLYQQSSLPLAITPIVNSQLQSVFWRERDPKQSTSFSFTRFLVPALMGYQGWAIFMDCDMLVLEDIAKLWALRDDRYAVMVVQHDHVPKEERKFLNEPQSKYQKKNWSSVMLFNNSRCRVLDPSYVNTASGLELHQFKWLESDELIGSLPKGWNHLVGHDEPDPAAHNVHFTTGGPYFKEYETVEHARDWFDERNSMNAVVQRAKGG